MKKNQKVSSPSQYSYVLTDKTPADVATWYSHTAITKFLQDLDYLIPMVETFFGYDQNGLSFNQSWNLHKSAKMLFLAKLKLQLKSSWTPVVLLEFLPWKISLKRFVRNKFQVNSKSEDKADIYIETEIIYR